MAVKSKVQRLNKRAKKQQKWKEQLSKNKPGQNNLIFTNVGLILGAFWENFGSQKALKNRVKFCMRFWSLKRLPEQAGTGRPGGMRGGPGEDYAAPPLAGKQRDKSHTRNLSGSRLCSAKLC